MMAFEGSGDTHSHRGRQGCWGGIPTRGKGGDGDGDHGGDGDGDGPNNHNEFMFITFPMIKIEVHTAGCHI